MRLWAIPTLLMATAGCAAPTSVLVVVDGDLEPRAELESLGFSVSRGGETLWVGTYGFDAGDELPQTLRILPGSRNSEGFLLSVTARQGSEDLLSVTRLAAFREGREVVERVCLYRACVGSDRPECAQGRCDMADADGDADVDGDGDSDADMDDDVDVDGEVDADEDGDVDLDVDGDGGADGCVAVTELCNGLDDDCDGVIDQEAGCPCEQRWSGSHAYLMCTSPLPWAEARSACVDTGYDLVTIEDELENDFVTTETTALSAASTHWWIGLSDQDEEGTFVWVATGLPPTWTSWGDGEPNDTAPGEDCAETNFSTPGTWNDDDCTDPQRFVCEAG